MASRLVLIASAALLLAGCSRECTTVEVDVPLAPQEACRKQSECDSLGITEAGRFDWPWDRVKYVDQKGRLIRSTCSGGAG